MSGSRVALFALASTLCARIAVGAPCPGSGGTVTIRAAIPEGASTAELTVSGRLLVPSCDLDGTTDERYQAELTCDETEGCETSFDGLAPGDWVHRIEVTAGEAVGQQQARRSLLLDAGAGPFEHDWQVYRSAFEVGTVADNPGCEDCLRRALEMAEAAAKPALVFFDRNADGSVRLIEALPPLASGGITIDGMDGDGLPHRRTIDAEGMSRAALQITSADNAVIGLRITNVGGDSDMLLIDGEQANGNTVESVQIVGRGLEICERSGMTGCVVDRRCVTPNLLFPRGNCGDDGIAIRNSAGQLTPNRLVDVDVSGAFDKGIKVSEGGVAVVEDSWIHGNSDGGIQATLEGNLTALRNRAEGNRGTAGANGIAANGARIGGDLPSVVISRGNIVRNNALRGISVRSRSLATLRDDFVCGNGTAGTEVGFGLALLDAAGFSADADVSGLALVNNVDGGVLTMGAATGRFGGEIAGRNAFSGNGPATALNNPTNFRHLSTQDAIAIGNHWQGCGPTYTCDQVQVAGGDVYAPTSTVITDQPRPNAITDAPTISEIVPTFAKAGDLVRIYGSNFDAVNAAAQDPGCTGIGRPCKGSDANCVIIDRQPAEVVAATPTMLVIRAPFTCVGPAKLLARTRRSRGAARATFCTQG